ncbi:SWIM zinc finger family protein [Nocardioides sp. DS6]|uniref:SWIM zinc finger family protein n=1 Tax=Nocardioides eburneus TaxID=3231482 RepID=A0ABV3SY69_9ACTN
MTAVTHQRQPVRRSAPRPESWWGRAFLRAIEEAAYDDGQLAAARALARSGRIAGLVVDAGSVAAAVDADGGLWTVTVALPVLDDASAAAFLEVLSTDHHRLDAVLAGGLPHDLVEHAEEAGVELVPYGGELGAACTCRHWHDVCVHALAVLHQLAWLVDRDAQVLLHLRGVPRDELLARLRRVAVPAADLLGSYPDSRDAAAGSEVDEVEIAFDAALRARRLLADG